MTFTEVFVSFGLADWIAFSLVASIIIAFPVLVILATYCTVRTIYRVAIRLWRDRKEVSRDVIDSIFL